MTAWVHVGPSFPELHRLDRQGILWRPPAAQGDVLAAVEQGATAIGIVDGVFGGEPSIWHKEILHALHRGVPVIGAASMGALRAAELAPFGMVGIGSIFAAYRDGLLGADDEVALLHGPAELGWPALSEPMVNIRATIARAVRVGMVAAGEATAALAAMKSLFYAERTVQALLARLPQLEARWQRIRVDAKRIDAARLVGAIRGLGPIRPSFAFNHTGPWRSLIACSPTLDSRPWALTALVAADNNLADAVLPDARELLAARRLDAVHLLAVVDSADPAICGDYRLRRGRHGWSLDHEPRAARDTGRGSLVGSALRRSRAELPAARRALLIWGHGEGWRVAIDDGSGDGLSTAELLEALRPDPLQPHGPLDLVVFDACLMGLLENVADLAGSADLVLASPEVVPASGLPYGVLIDRLAEAADPRSAAIAIARGYLDDARARGELHARITVAETAAGGVALAVVGRIGTRLLGLLPGHRAQVAEARLLAQSCRAGDQVDALDLAHRLAQRTGDPTLALLAAELGRLMTPVVAFRGSLRPAGPTIGGLNLWFPAQPGWYARHRADYVARPSIRCWAAGWARFLDDYHGVRSAV